MKYLFVFLSIALFHSSYAQEENIKKHSKWYLKPSAGMNFSTKDLASGEITDNLIGYDNRSTYLQFISGNYFLSHNWGVELTVRFDLLQNIAHKEDDFNNRVLERYGEAYYVRDTYNSLYIHELSVWGYLGVVYRIEKARFIFMPKASVGLISIDLSSASIRLKEKGTNQIFSLEYRTDEPYTEKLILAPGFTLGYRLSKRLIANFDLLYSFFTTDFSYTERVQNNFTEASSSRSISYNRNIHTFSIGLGLIIELKPVNRDK